MAQPAALHTRAAEYLPTVRGLLASRGLTVPEGTVWMLARTIARCRHLPSKGQQQQPKKDLNRALTHARALLRYAERRPSRASSVEDRLEKLLGALNTPDAWIWLSTARVDVSNLLERLSADALDKDALTTLIQALEWNLSGTRSGRLLEQQTKVVRGAYITWQRGGRTEAFTWDDPYGVLKGPLPAFARDLLSLCGFDEMTDAAIHQALKRCHAELRLDR